MNVVHACGCADATDGDTGLTRSASKCEYHLSHATAPESLGEDYYGRIGVVSAGRPVATGHVAELAEAVGAFPAATPGRSRALEVGCGASPYCPALLAAGYSYLGVEPSPWAAEFTSREYGVPVVRDALEGAAPSLGRFDLALAAHCLEHTADAPRALALMAGLLDAGGLLYVVVPDDSDRLNPDHLWFFTGRSLLGLCEGVGLDTLAYAARRVVPHEEFLYYLGRKR